jgi:2-oxoglutarate ferredoxin oxidoreductase subunit alpha
MNTGQLRRLVRAEYLVDAKGYNRVRGLPFKAEELEHVIVEMLEGASLP